MIEIIEFHYNHKIFRIFQFYRYFSQSKGPQSQIDENNPLNYSHLFNKFDLQVFIFLSPSVSIRKTLNLDFCFEV